MGALPKLYFTPEEYLALESSAEYKSQYVAGEIFAMAGAQPWHDDVANNIRNILHTQFRGRPCKYYSSDVRVQVTAGDMYTYPDVSALCGVPTFDTADSPQSLVNPQVIFEVLSPSTEGFDRGEKFRRYRKMESLVDYILVSADRRWVEHYMRQPTGAWTLAEHDLPGHVLEIETLGCRLPLENIYENVVFPSAG